MSEPPQEEPGYLSGFGNHFATEALPGALPAGQNSPQQCPYGLYAEQLSGTAFTVPRAENQRSWLYRIRPSVVQGSYQLADSVSPDWKTAPLPEEILPDPNQKRWDPLPYPREKKDFLGGLKSYAVSGRAAEFQGCASHLYSCNQSMEKRFFYNADGELLIVPQEGALRIRTELGELELAPGEMALIPRGIKFQIKLLEASARGYVCENYGRSFRLPELGPIGANGLANPRDFLAPVAQYEDLEADFELIAKFQGHFWQVKLDHSPLDVVAWHGNYCPYKYDLAKFNTINTVSFDHPDPSIFTVLTAPSEQRGLANVDFVIFPPRWMVAEHTFRPPYYHRNVMSEFMGLLYGSYDAKEDDFKPGGASLHNCLSPHGPDANAFEKATQAELKPEYYANTLALMFESRFVFQTTPFAQTTELIQKDYQKCWQGLKKHFLQ